MKTLTGAIYLLPSITLPQYVCSKYIDLVPIIDTYGLHIRLANVKKGQVKLGVETCCATPKNRYFFISSNRVME